MSVFLQKIENAEYTGSIDISHIQLEVFNIWPCILQIMRDSNLNHENQISSLLLQTFLSSK